MSQKRACLSSLVIGQSQTKTELSWKQFPAPEAGCVYLLHVVIGSFKCLRLLWLAKGITIVLGQSRGRRYISFKERSISVKRRFHDMMKTSLFTFLLPFNVLMKAVVITKTGSIWVAVFLSQQDSFFGSDIGRARKTSVKLNDQSAKIFRIGWKQ